MIPDKEMLEYIDQGLQLNQLPKNYYTLKDPAKRAIIKNLLEKGSHGRKIVFQLTISKQWEDNLGWHYFSETPSSGKLKEYSIEDLLTIIGTFNDMSKYFAEQIINQASGKTIDKTLWKGVGNN